MLVFVESLCFCVVLDTISAVSTLFFFIAKDQRKCMLKIDQIMD
uniref:Uncharacterized protein n=1 Tax=Rhizophora mucronata TaxID=61149 RepID=A0A2P2N4D8_RHIMU